MHASTKFGKRDLVEVGIDNCEDQVRYLRVQVGGRGRSTNLEAVLRLARAQTNKLHLEVLILADTTDSFLRSLLDALQNKVSHLSLTLHYFPPELGEFMSENGFAQISLDIHDELLWDGVLDELPNWRAVRLVVRDAPVGNRLLTGLIDAARRCNGAVLTIGSPHEPVKWRGENPEQAWLLNTFYLTVVAVLSVFAIAGVLTTIDFYNGRP